MIIRDGTPNLQPPYTTLVSEIAEGAAEQSTGLEEINTGVVQLDQVTQQNAAMVEETTAASNMLNTNAQQLGDIVQRFKIHGDQTVSAPAQTEPSADDETIALPRAS